MSRQRVAVLQPASMEPFAAAVSQIRGEMGELARLSQTIPEPAHEFAALIGRLTQSLDELHQALCSRAGTKPDRVSDSTCEPAVKQEDRSHRMGTHAVGNSRILEWFSRPIGQVRPGESHRYPFAVQQPMAVCKGEELPAPAEFEPVQCHDLSPAEIRYVVDHRPREGDVVFGLGITRPIKFLLARVEDYRSVYMYGRVGYLVTARFESAVERYLADQTVEKAAAAAAD